MVILSFTLGYALLPLHGSLVTTSQHRVPLIFTLGYALLRLMCVLVAVDNVRDGYPLYVGCIYLSIGYLAPLSPWRGVGGEAKNSGAVTAPLLIVALFS